MKRRALSNRLGRAFQGRSRGMTLIEVLIALALFTIIAMAFLGGLTAASRAVFVGDVRTNAESLARTQMEYVKNQGYIDYSDDNRDPRHYSLIDYPAPYYITVRAEPIDPGTGQPYSIQQGDTFERDDGIQMITVTVSHHGKEVITLEGYKREP